VLRVLKKIKFKIPWVGDIRRGSIPFILTRKVARVTFKKFIEVLN